MRSEQVTTKAIQVRGRGAVAIQHEGRNLVSMQCLCDPIGLDPLTEFMALKGNAGMAEVAHVVTEPLTGQRVCCIEEGSIEYWVTTIDPARLPRDRRDDHLAWCREVRQAIHDYRVKGVAANAAVLGDEGKRQVEALAAKFSVTEHVRVLDSALRTAVELMSSDPATVTYAKLAFKSALRDAAGESGPAAVERTHATVRSIGMMAGIVLTAEAAKQFGGPAAAWFRKEFKGEKIPTNLQLGLEPELGAHSLVEVEANAFPRKAWPHIQRMIEEKFAREGERCGYRVARAA